MRVFLFESPGSVSIWVKASLLMLKLLDDGVVIDPSSPQPSFLPHNTITVNGKKVKLHGVRLPQDHLKRLRARNDATELKSK
jgi:hypothetical protein